MVTIVLTIHYIGVSIKATIMRNALVLARSLDRACRRVSTKVLDVFVCQVCHNGKLDRVSKRK